MHAIRHPPSRTGHRDVAPTRTRPTDSAAALRSLKGRIAISDDVRDVYTIRPDGTRLTRLTTAPGNDFDPSWSPDGSRIAFRSERDGDSEIYVMDADGSDQTDIARDPATDWSPAWSPDGSMIAFASDRADGAGDIFTMRPDGTGLRRVTSWPSIEEYPSWAPDSRRLAFMSNHEGQEDLYTVDIGGSDLARLTTSGGVLPAWSPRGDVIAFGGKGPSEGKIVTLNLVGSVTRVVANGYFPTWSPDGRVWMFAGGAALHFVDLRGENLGSFQIPALAELALPSWGP